MSELLHLERLKEGKVLLAYSGGADSTALFHLLVAHNIDFDIAHVNYQTRPTSDSEAAAAEDNARRFGRTCHTTICRLGGSNFEHRAREERYRFFGYLIRTHHYSYLLTAHQLNDRLEWLMMQLCRGSGLPELLGIRSYDERDGIKILRPLLEWDRNAIEAYLHEHSLPYFIDESNADERYTRNFFRHRFSAPIMREYTEAIRRSFRYLEEDRDLLIQPIAFDRIEQLYYARNGFNRRSLVQAIDALFKSLGYVLRSKDRLSLKEERCCLIVGREYVVSVEEEYTFVTPYVSNVVMDKGFKEECRKRSIEPKLRGYLYGNSPAWEVMRRLKDVQGRPQSGILR